MLERDTLPDVNTSETQCLKRDTKRYSAPQVWSKQLFLIMVVSFIQWENLMMNALRLCSRWHYIATDQWHITESNMNMYTALQTNNLYGV